MTTWLWVGVLAVSAWILLSVGLALVVGAVIEHGERVPRLRRRATVVSMSLAGRARRIAS